MSSRIQKTPSVLERTVDALRTEVNQERQPGTRLATIAVLAQRLGVSTNTVRSALTILQREGWVELRHGSGTYVSEPPRDGKHVALVAEIDLLHSVTAYFHREMFCRLRRHLIEAGHAVRFYIGTCVPGTIDAPCYSDVAAGQVVADLDRISAIGAFVMLRDEPWAAPARERGMPIVSNDPALGPAVIADRDDLLRRAVASLAATGCRRIGYLGWDPAFSEYAPSNAAGLHEQMPSLAVEYGMTTRPGWMSYASHPSTSGAGWEQFRDIWRSGRERPDGLVIADDQLLTGVFEALAAAGVSVPGQLRIATHFTEGMPLHLPCPVIKIQYSPADHARAMAELLLAALRGEPAPAAPVRVPHRVVMPSEKTVVVEEALRLSADLVTLTK